jgi:hypothetical protein
VVGASKFFHLKIHFDSFCRMHISNVERRTRAVLLENSPGAPAAAATKEGVEVLDVPHERPASTASPNRADPSFEVGFPKGARVLVGAVRAGLSCGEVTASWMHGYGL